MKRLRNSALAMPRAFFGRTLLGAAAVAWGVEYAIAQHTRDGLPPLPWSAPGGAILAAMLSLVLPLLGVALIGRFRLVETSFILGIILMAGACVHLIHLTAVLHDPLTRNLFLQPIALACGAFVLCRLAQLRQHNYLFLSARALFAFTMIAFGLNHFLYTGYIATLIPDWMPLHLVLTRGTGICLIAAGIAMLSGFLAQPAAFMLAIMFALWLGLLDVPAMRAYGHDAGARLNAEMLLGLIGTSLLMATSPRLPSLKHDVYTGTARL